MARYVAFLRGVSPMNAKMSDLRRCFETGGFTNVKTVLASGNVVFDAPSRPDTAIARAVETTMAKHLDRVFYTIVRSTAFLRELIDSDPYAVFRPPSNAKRVVTFLREPYKGELTLPVELNGAQILSVNEREVLTVYVPSPLGAQFMVLIEKTFGKNVTTRTWDTVKKCSNA